MPCLHRGLACAFSLLGALGCGGDAPADQVAASSSSTGSEGGAVSASDDSPGTGGLDASGTESGSGVESTGDDSTGDADSGEGPDETVAPLWELELEYADVQAAVAADLYLEAIGAPDRNSLSDDVPAGTEGRSWRVQIPEGGSGGGGFNVWMPQSYPFAEPPLQDTSYPVLDSYWRYHLKFETGFIHDSAVGCGGGSAGLKVHLTSVYQTETGNGRFDHIHNGSTGQTGFSVNIIGAPSDNTHDIDLDPETLLYDGQWHTIMTRRFLHGTEPVFEIWIDGIPVHDVAKPSVPSELWTAESFTYGNEFIGTYNCAAESEYPDGLTQDVSYLAHGVQLWSPDNPASGIPDWYTALPADEKYP